VQRNDRQVQICRRSVSQSDLIRPMLTWTESQGFIQPTVKQKVCLSLKTKTMVVLLALAVLVGSLSGAVLTTPAVHAMNGSVYGGVYWVDQYGNMRLMSWAQVTADNGESRTTASTTNGSYVLFLTPGTYTITAESGNPAFFPDSADNIAVSPGSSTSLDFTLQPTGKPVPELPPWAQPLILLSAIVVTVVCVRRYRPRPQA